MNLTQKEIEKMPAGPDMDALILAAMGWEVHLDTDADMAVRYMRDGACLWQGDFHPSKDAAAALAVLDFFEDLSIYREEYQYTVDIVVAPNCYGHGNAKRLPLAICRAVLLGYLQEGGADAW